MTVPADLQNRLPEEIEWEIEATRTSLHSKVHELERRLDPRHRLHRLKGNVRKNAPWYQAIAAIAAIAAGTWLAVRGWGRWRSSDMYLSPDHPALARIVDLTCE